MTSETYYSTQQQFCRALVAQYRLHGVDALYGILYVLVGFYCFHGVGQSQVYNAITPCVLAAVYMIYITWHMCAASTRSRTAHYYFNLPQARTVAFYAQLSLLGIITLWLLAWVWVGCLFKLGGAGITACYRIHPEFLVFPFLAMSATVRHIYQQHSWAYWRRTGLLFIIVCCWVAWKIYAIKANPPGSGNHFWPDRDMSLFKQLCVAATIMVFSWYLISTTHKQWRERQIGAIQ